MKTNNNPLEALLRPPIELYSTAVLLSATIIALFAPWALMMPAWLGVVAAVIAAGFAWKRFKEAMYVLRYQHGMKYYKVTKVAPHKLPVIPEKLYLGEGFEWTQRHTQRKRDATRPEATPFVKPSPKELTHRSTGLRLNNWLSKEIQIAKDSSGYKLPLLKLTSAMVNSDAWWNPLTNYPDLGGSPILHGVGSMEEQPIGLRQSSRNGHTLVKGTTRVGKTRCLEMFATQDIHCGKVVIVIDPKGDAELMLRLYAEAKRAGRLDQFYLFHLGYPEISARYNGIGNFSRITEVAARATNALPSSGNSAAFKEFSWRFTNIVAQAQVALGRVPTYETLLADVTSIDALFTDYANMYYRKLAAEGVFKDYESKLKEIEALVIAKKAPVPRSMQDREPSLVAMFLYIRETKVNDRVLQGLAAAFSYERSFYEKIIASLGPFLEKLTTGPVGKLISPDYFDSNDTRPIFDWMTVLRQGGIVYAGLDALSDSVVSSAVGNSMLADLVSVGGKLYKEGLDPATQKDGKLILPDVCCHFDEVNEIAGPEFVPMVNKLGGSGFKITAYTQSLFDIEAKVGSKAQAGQIMDNFNHLIMFRVRSIATANLLTEQVPQVEVVHLTPMSGVSDTAAQGTGVDFTSRNDDIITTTKVPMIEPADILQLPQGQAYCSLEGNRLFKIRLPLSDTTDDAFIPESILKVAEEMKKKYKSSEHWAKDGDWLGNQPIGQPNLIDLGLAVGAADELLNDDTAKSNESIAMVSNANALSNNAVFGHVMGGGV